MNTLFRIFNSIGAVTLSWACLNLLTVSTVRPVFDQSSSVAVASSSGGRSRGGSFDAPSAPSAPSSGGFSDPGFGSGGYSGSWPAPPSSGIPRGGYYYPDDGYYPDRGYSRGPVIMPMPRSGYRVPPAYPGGYVTTTPASGGGFSLLLLFLTAGMLLVVFPMVTSAMRTKTHTAGRLSGGDLYNAIVTVSKLQVAMLAEARYIQEALTQLTAEANLETKDGLAQALQEAVLAILRSPEYWTHAKGLSKTVNSRQEAARLFEEWSTEERVKLSSETLVNLGGRIRRQETKFTPDVAPASYIVVTLLVGSEDDRPLFGAIQSAEDLKAALKRLASITPQYILVYELIWAPQDASDTLTRDEFVADYADLIQIG